jgi:hypothetical protein
VSILYFVVALIAIVVFAVTLNRFTGTQPNDLENLQLAPGEKELWRDAQADFGLVPRVARSAVISFPRLRRHTIVWTNRRVVISQKALFSRHRMITHQIYFADQAGSQASAAAASTFGGFFGRGYETVIAARRSSGTADGKPCVRIEPAEESRARLNLEEILIFTDRLPDLEQTLR